MIAVSKGDEDAMAILVNRHIDALYSYAYRLARSHPTAEDLVQETWLTVWQKSVQFDPRRAKLTTWLHRVLHNKFIDHTRTHKFVNDRSVPADSLTSATTTNAEKIPLTSGPEQINLDEANLAITQQLIDKLPIAQKAALTLSYAQGMSNPDIAHILGQSVRAVESLLARARKKLRRSFVRLPDSKKELVMTTTSDNKRDQEQNNPPNQNLFEKRTQLEKKPL